MAKPKMTVRQKAMAKKLKQEVFAYKVKSYTPRQLKSAMSVTAPTQAYKHKAGTAQPPTPHNKMRVTRGGTITGNRYSSKPRKR